VKMKCRRCSLEVEVEDFAEIAEIQGFQCPAAIAGAGHWLLAVK